MSTWELELVHGIEIGAARAVDLAIVKKVVLRVRLQISRSRSDMFPVLPTDDSRAALIPPYSLLYRPRALGLPQLSFRVAQAQHGLTVPVALCD